MVKIGVQVFTNRDQLKSEPSKTWDNPDARIGKDGITLEFVYLNDLKDDTPVEDRIIQYYEYAWLEGTTGRKTWSVHIPSGEDDPQALKDTKKPRYQYASNVLIIKAYWTDKGPEGDCALRVGCGQGFVAVSVNDLFLLERYF